MKFAHLADIHLGYHQYGLDQRAEDIAKAWMWACAKIAQEKCDFAILAGDLFHHRQVDPVTLSVAMAGLRMMNCPVYMIKGNHEMMRTATEIDWIDFLVSENLVTVPEPAGVAFFEPNHAQKRDRKRSGYVKIFGLDYQGMATDRVVSNLMIPSKQEGDFVILMLHAGLEGMLPQNHPGTVSWDVLRQYIANVNYVALGHVHKPYVDGWVHNPGSLETISTDEYQWHDRGLLINDVAQDGSFTTQLYVPPRREFYFLDDLWFGIAEVEDFEQLNGAIVILNSSNPKETLDIMDKVCQPLYVKINKIKKETKEVQLQTFSKYDMEREAIKQLTDIAPEKVLELKGIKDGPTIWQKVE